MEKLRRTQPQFEDKGFISEVLFEAL